MSAAIPRQILSTDGWRKVSIAMHAAWTIFIMFLNNSLLVEQQGSTFAHFIPIIQPYTSLILVAIGLGLGVSAWLFQLSKRRKYSLAIILSSGFILNLYFAGTKFILLGVSVPAWLFWAVCALSLWSFVCRLYQGVDQAIWGEQAKLNQLDERQLRIYHYYNSRAQSNFAYILGIIYWSGAAITVNGPSHQYLPTIVLTALFSHLCLPVYLAYWHQEKLEEDQ